MAFFGGHDTEDINVTLENSAIYESEVGLGVIALECTQFEAEIFADCVRSDMKESALVKEGADVEAFQEGAWETVKNKVVEFVKKVWAKVKAFFNGWYAKIAARVMSDNKAFYNKFKKSVEGKTDLAKLEVKWEEPTKADYGAKDIDGLGDLTAFAESDASDIISKIYTGSAGDASSHSEAKKNILEAAFEDEKEVSYTSVASDVVTELTSSTGIKDAQKKFKDVDGKLAKSVAKITKGKEEVKNITVIANAVAKAQVVVAECGVAIAKKKAAQARRVFAKAVAYSPKSEGAFDADLLAVEADALMHE